MSEIIDLALHQASVQVVDDLLDRRGLGYFLEKGAKFPYALSKRRVELAIQLANRRIDSDPPPEAVQHCRRMVRRRLIALVTDAMLEVGY